MKYSRLFKYITVKIHLHEDQMKKKSTKCGFNPKNPTNLMFLIKFQVERSVIRDNIGKHFTSLHCDSF